MSFVLACPTISFSLAPVSTQCHSISNSSDGGSGGMSLLDTKILLILYPASYCLLFYFSPPFQYCRRRRRH